MIVDTRTDTPATSPGPGATTRDPGRTHDGEAVDRRDGALRPTLWLLLLLLAAANTVTSMVGMVAVSIPLGLGVLGTVVALVVHHRRTRP